MIRIPGYVRLGGSLCAIGWSVACAAGAHAEPADLPPADVVGPAAVVAATPADVGRRVERVSGFSRGYARPLHYGSAGEAPAAGGAAKGEAGGGDLAQKSANPAEPLMNFALIDYYSPEYHDADDLQRNQLIFRALIPFKVGCMQHLPRFSLPLVTEGPGDVTGTGDFVVFDLVVFKAGGILWGVGASLMAPTGEVGLSTEKWSVGPAFLMVVVKGKFLWGVLNQNFFSFAGEEDAPDVAQSVVQPFASLNLGCGWALGTSEMTWTYDWELERWTNFPVGVSLSVVKPFQGQPIKYSVSADYNLADDFVVPEMTFTFGITFLFP
jgi:hypothetical protein